MQQSYADYQALVGTFNRIEIPRNELRRVLGVR